MIYPQMFTHNHVPTTFNDSQSQHAKPPKKINRNIKFRVDKNIILLCHDFLILCK